VVANHPSYSDPAFLMAACLRPLRFLHARESFETFGLHRLFARVGSIPVGRKGQDVAAVRAALRLLSAGEAVCVFPEGEVHPTGADPAGPVRAGAAFLALVSKAPVYPARIVGGPQSHEILRDWLWPSRGVQVLFGPSVDLSGYYGRRLTRALLQEVAALLQQRIAELQPVTGPCRQVPS
jgi:1-acyl-sn-glycerol-3-phosphate acyltransferase